MGDEKTNTRGALNPDRLRSANTWEELAALPGFRSEQVRVEDMRRGQVVGQYSMKGTEMRRCGIASCSQPHKHGFIVELPDGTLSNVGKVCGKNKLGVSFDQMLARYRATRKASAKAQATIAARDEARAAIAEVLRMPTGLQAAHALLNTLDSLPSRLKAVLERLATAGDGQIVRRRNPTAEEIRRAKFMGEPRPTVVSEVITNISEIKAVMPVKRADFVAEKRIPQAVEQLEALLADPTATADMIAAKVRVLRDTRNLLDRSIERAARFFTPGNVAKLGYLEDVDAPARVAFSVGPPPRLTVAPAISKR